MYLYTGRMGMAVSGSKFIYELGILWSWNSGACDRYACDGMGVCQIYTTSSIPVCCDHFRHFTETVQVILQNSVFWRNVSRDWMVMVFFQKNADNGVVLPGCSLDLKSEKRKVRQVPQRPWIWSIPNLHRCRQMDLQNRAGSWSDGVQKKTHLCLYTSQSRMDGTLTNNEEMEISLKAEEKEEKKSWKKQRRFLQQLCVAAW